MHKPSCRVIIHRLQLRIILYYIANWIRNSYSDRVIQSNVITCVDTCDGAKGSHRLQTWLKRAFCVTHIIILIRA